MIAPHRRIVEADPAHRAQREQLCGETAAVGRVGRVQHLLGPDEREQREQVERRPGRGVEEDVRVAVRPLADAALLGDRGVGEDQGGLGVTVRHAPELLRHPGRQAAAGVDQYRQPALGGEGEHRLEPGIVDAEHLRPRVQLDPARTAIDAPLGLGHGRLVEQQAREGNEASVTLFGPGQHAIVGRAVGRQLVGLVEREHHRVGDAGRIHLRDVGLGSERATVGIEAEVGMHVDDADALGPQIQQLGVQALDQRHHFAIPVVAHRSESSAVSLWSSHAGCAAHARSLGHARRHVRGVRVRGRRCLRVDRDRRAPDPRRRWLRGRARTARVTRDRGLVGRRMRALGADRARPAQTASAVRGDAQGPRARGCGPRCRAGLAGRRARRPSSLQRRRGRGSRGFDRAAAAQQGRARHRGGARGSRRHRSLPRADPRAAARRDRRRGRRVSCSTKRR